MKLLFAAILVAIASMLATGSVFAQTNDVILQRLDALEKENAALRDRMRNMESRKQATAPVIATTTQDSKSSTTRATTAYASATPVYKATSPAAPVLGKWSGFYVGAHGGYASGSFLPPCCFQGGSGASSVALAGGFGGLQAGYNYQFAPHWLIGVEQDISFGNISGYQTQLAPNPNVGISTNYSGTVRERFGYIWDSLLLYETAGIAWAHNKVNLETTPPVSDTHLQFGVALGAGMEWAVNPNLSVKVEYLYSYITKEQEFAGTSNAGLAGWPLSTLRAGVNWRFN